jgi:uncharacterized protein (TIGR00369 family)
MSEAEAKSPTPPEGFSPMPDRGPFTTQNGPIFRRRREGGAEQAFFAEARHCNAFDLVHGGMLSGLMDGCMAHAVGAVAGRGGVTIHLSIDFLSSVKAGAWVFAEALVTRATSEIVFVEARLHADGQDVARGSAVFKLFRKPD